MRPRVSCRTVQVEMKEPCRCSRSDFFFDCRHARGKVRGAPPGGEPADRNREILRIRSRPEAPFLRKKICARLMRPSISTDSTSRARNARSMNRRENSPCGSENSFTLCTWIWSSAGKEMRMSLSDEDAGTSPSKTAFEGEHFGRRGARRRTVDGLERDMASLCHNFSHVSAAGLRADRFFLGSARERSFLSAR